MIFSDLTEAAFARKLLGFLGMFFVFFERRSPYPLDLDHIWSISWEEHHFFLFDPFCSIIFEFCVFWVFNLFFTLVLFWGFFLSNKDFCVGLWLNKKI
jgi:hypothetical protein